jgi:hypothetical protein
MLPSFFALLRAIQLGLRFRCKLQIRTAELWPYLRKCSNLGLCYGGFVPTTWTIETAFRAGDVAFLCCAYDVATDWRSFSPYHRDVLNEVLKELVPSWACEITMDLYEREIAGILRDDGLERGAIAFDFAVGVIGIQSQFTKREIAELGVLLQIVDDVLDLESDRANGELNCLLSPRREVYLNRLNSGIAGLSQRFATSPVMAFVLRRVEAKNLALINCE